jgi:hypothetical protein
MTAVMPDWRKRAHCSSMDPDLWIDDKPGYHARAVHECRTHCPVLAECIKDAHANPEYVAGTIRGGVLWLSNYVKSQPLVEAKSQPRTGTCPTCSPRLPRSRQVPLTGEQYPLAS